MTYVTNHVMRTLGYPLELFQSSYSVILSDGDFIPHTLNELLSYLIA